VLSADRTASRQPLDGVDTSWFLVLAAVTASARVGLGSRDAGWFLVLDAGFEFPLDAGRSGRRLVPSAGSWDLGVAAWD
jgi:hypothetical protein